MGEGEVILVKESSFMGPYAGLHASHDAMRSSWLRRVFGALPGAVGLSLDVFSIFRVPGVSFF